MTDQEAKRRQNRRAVVLGIATAVAMLGLPATAAHANLLVNGGFEAPVLSTGFEIIGVGPGPAGFGWTVKTPVNVFRSELLGAVPAYEGAQALDLVATSGVGRLAQSFATVAGATYTLSFAYANNPFGVTSASALVSILDGDDTLTSATITHSGSTTANADWTLFSIDFVAESSLTTLDFLNLTGGPEGGILLDAVSVEGLAPTAVPEPATLALLGLGLIGVASYRRGATRSR